MLDNINPKLPPEIEEVIFSLAMQGDLRDCVHLTLVAKRVYEWVIPHLYNMAIIHISSFHRRPTFDPELLKTQGRHVRHLILWIFAGSDLSKAPNSLYDTAAFLSWCPNIVNLALWSSGIIYSEAMVDTLLSLPLVHFSFNIEMFHSHLTQFSISRQISFVSVTHLYLVGTYITLSMDKITEYFPSITHIALHEMRRVPAQSILEGWKDQLQVLVWLLHRKEVADDYFVPDDLRVVLMLQSAEYVTDWQKAAEDRPESIWRVAEREVKRRREIPSLNRRRVITLGGE